MNVLSAIMPGLRELRAPLSAGFLWLMVGLLYASARYGELNPPKTGSGYVLWRNASRIASVQGFSVLATLTFCAYTIGMVSCSAATRVAAFLDYALSIIRRFEAPHSDEFLSAYGPGRVVDALRGENLVRHVLSERFLREGEFREAVLTRIDESVVHEYRMEKGRPGRLSAAVSGRRPKQSSALKGLEKETEAWGEFARKQSLSTPSLRWFLISEALHVQRYVGEIEDELRLLPHVLDAKGSRAFDRWDRLRGEADFRLALALPTAGSSVPLSMMANFAPWGILPVLVAAIFLMIGASKSQEAGIVLFSVFQADEIVTSPVLKRLRAGELYWRPPLLPSSGVQ